MSPTVAILGRSYGEAGHHHVNLFGKPIRMVHMGTTDVSLWDWSARQIRRPGVSPTLTESLTGSVAEAVDHASRKLELAHLDFNLARIELEFLATDRRVRRVHRR